MVGATQHSVDELETPAEDTPASCYEDLRNQRADGERPLPSTRQLRSVVSYYVSTTREIMTAPCSGKLYDEAGNALSLSQ